MTEIMSRELIGNLTLAAHIAARGHVAIILNQEDAFVLSRASVSGTTIFHAKSLHFAKERILQHEKLSEAGFLLTSMDQENVLLNPDIPLILSGRFCEENLEIAQRVFTWNQVEAEELSRQFPQFAEKIVGYGSPRVDSWSPRFRGLGQLPAKSKRQILLTPSVGVNHHLRHWEIWAIWKSVVRNGLISDEDEQQMLNSFHDDLRSQVFFCRLALRLADAFPDRDVVIQPKKSEVRDSWDKSLYAFDTSGDGTRSNLHLEYSRILEESIHSAEVVVNSTSTAGLTALIGQVPLVSFGPTESMASRLGAQVATVEQGFAHVSEALANPKKFVGKYEQENLEMLGGRLTMSNSCLASESILNDMESFDSGIRSRLTLRDLVLFLYPGALRRVLSALKAVIKFQRPAWADPEMVAKVRQTRVKELLRQIVAGTGKDVKLKAVVAGGRNIVVMSES